LTEKSDILAKLSLEIKYKRRDSIWSHLLTIVRFDDDAYSGENASKDYKVVVSGFAKGVDKQALDSAIKYNGQSIIGLPQGIATFQSGFKKYYKQIIEGDVLAITDHPTRRPQRIHILHSNCLWKRKYPFRSSSLVHEWRKRCTYLASTH
jgi:hypothetical protein